MRSIFAFFVVLLISSFFANSAFAQAAALPVIDKAGQTTCVFQKGVDFQIAKITNLLPNTSYSWTFADSAAVFDPSTWAGAARHDGFTTKSETSHALTLPATDTKNVNEGVYLLCVVSNKFINPDKCTGNNVLTIKITNAPPSGDTSCNQTFPTITPSSATSTSCSYFDCNGKYCGGFTNNNISKDVPVVGGLVGGTGRKECIITQSEPLACECKLPPLPPPPPCDKSALDPKTGMCTKIHTAIGDIETTPVGFAKVVFGIVLSLAGGIAVLLIIVSGYQIMTSQGNPEKIQGARETLTSTVIGLAFMIFSLVLLQIIGVDLLHIPGFSK